MIGGLFAGLAESPGELILYQGRTFKVYRGMGSLGAMVQGSSERYRQEAMRVRDKLVPEGVEGRVPFKGPLGAIRVPARGRVAGRDGILRHADHRGVAHGSAVHPGVAGQCPGESSS